jgi:hypothetical protein
MKDALIEDEEYKEKIEDLDNLYEGLKAFDSNDPDN